MKFEYLKNLEPYGLNKKEKAIFFEKEINSLTLYHYKKSKNYKTLLKKKNRQMLSFLNRPNSDNTISQEKCYKFNVHAYFV